MSRRKCIIEECGAELPEHGRSEFCENCKRWDGYWKRRTAAQFIKYRSRLTKAASRVERLRKSGKPQLRLIEGRKHGTG